MGMDAYTHTHAPDKELWLEISPFGENLVELYLVVMMSSDGLFPMWLIKALTIEKQYLVSHVE